MDFNLSKPQQLLQSSAREFFARGCPSSKVRELVATDTALDQELWDGIADQGWTGLTLPEAHGGLELGMVELAVVAEAMGEVCFPGPFVSNLWAAETLVGVGGDAAAAHLPAIAEGTRRATVALLEESADWDPAGVRTEAERSGDDVVLRGAKLFVGDASTADTILWVTRLDGQVALVAVPSEGAGVCIEETPAVDLTRKLCRVVLDGVTVPGNEVLAVGAQAERALERGMQRATVATCAEMVGGMQWMLDTALEYVRSRKQFDRAIGEFQAVQHHCANMFVGLESSRSATYYAAYRTSEESEDAARTVSIAKSRVSDSAREVGNLAVQVHGGIGFTWEHDLTLYYRRAKGAEIVFGDASFHRERLARAVLDEQVA